MANFTVSITGLDEFVAKLSEFKARLTIAMQGAGAAAATMIIETEGGPDNYPPLSEANQPGRYSVRTHKPMGYYERGIGWYYPVMNKPPTVRGISRSVPKVRGYGVAGYKLSNSNRSSVLKQKAEITHDNADVIITIPAEKVHYAEYVVGDYQAKFHAARGWRTLKSIAEGKRPEITAEYDRAIANLISDLGLD